MKLNELKNGDIVVTRYGIPGAVIKRKDMEYILMEDNDYILTDDYHEDMTHKDDEDEDIMLVYRSDDCEPVTFFEFEYQWNVYERDAEWHIPDVKEKAARLEKIRQEEEKLHRKWLKVNSVKANPVQITIVDHSCYRSREITDMTADEVKRLIRQNWTIVHIPNAEHIVLLYDRTAEERRRAHMALFADGYVPKTTAVIPSLNLTLYSRCIVCRMDDDGEPQSIRKQDYQYFMSYLSK